MQVILISGKAGSGKDVAGSAMYDALVSSEKITAITHFADYVKYIASKYFGWDGVKNEFGRYILTKIGEDVKGCRPAYWADRVVDELLLYGGWDYAIIPDWRFMVEYDVICKQFGKENVTTVRVEREFKSALTEKQLSHVSETQLDNFKFDYVISEDKIKETILAANNIIGRIL